jgi:hypothetical protein
LNKTTKSILDLLFINLFPCNEKAVEQFNFQLFEMLTLSPFITKGNILIVDLYLIISTICSYDQTLITAFIILLIAMTLHDDNCYN